MDYTIKFNTFDNPEIDFQIEEEINNSNFNLLENEYDIQDITAEIELSQYQDFLQQFNATSDI